MDENLNIGKIDEIITDKKDKIKKGQKVIIDEIERKILDVNNDEILIEIDVLNDKGIKVKNKQWYHINILE